MSWGTFDLGDYALRFLSDRQKNKKAKKQIVFLIS